MSDATACDLCGTTSSDMVCPACLSGTLAPARFFRCGACQCVWAGFSVCPVCDGVGEATTVAGTLADDEVSDEDPDVDVSFPPDVPSALVVATFASAQRPSLTLVAPVGPDTTEGATVNPVPIIPEAPVPGVFSRILSVGAKVLAVVGPALAVVAPLVVGGPLGLLLTQVGIGASFLAGVAAERGPLVGRPVVSGALLAVCVLVAEQGLTLAAAMPPGALQSGLYLAVCVAAILAGLPVPTDRIFKRTPPPVA